MFAKRAFLELRDAKCGEYALGSPAVAQIVRVLIAVIFVAAIPNTAAAAPTVTPAASTVPAGAPLIFTVVNDGTPSPMDWLALYPTVAPDGAYITWQYMNGLKTAAPSTGLASATLRFSAPLTPGTYEVRFFSNNTFARLATSSTVTVPAPTVTVTDPTVAAGTSIEFVVAGGPANPVDWVGLYRTTTGDGAYLTWQYLNGTKMAPATGQSGATLQFAAPITPGTYELRFFSNNTFTRLATSGAVTVTGVATSLTLAATTLPIGAPIRFSIAGGPANPTDWVGLYPASASDTGYVTWQFLNGTKTAPPTGMAAAMLQFSPTAPGAYELRFFSSNTFTRLATSSTVTVTSTASVTVSTPAVTAAPIKFVVAGGPANSADWVALYPAAAADGGYIAWQYMNGRTSTPATGIAGASLWFPAPATAGTYELRFFSNNTFLKLATSGPVTVGALPVPTASTFVSGLRLPVGFVQDPVDTTVQYVIEQGGRIRVVKSGVLQSTDFLDLSGQIVLSSEQGLLGLAFPPDYATSHRFYASFTGPNGNVVARFTHSANRLVANAASRFDLRWSGTGLRYIAQPFGNHNGGNIAFGPDGYLYIGRGDGGSSNDPFRNAQNRSSLLGKMLRIDVNVADADPNGYVVPVDNPFVSASPTRPEIWAFGLRNPWRFSFDDGPGGTDALVIGDVGQGSWEEVDYELPNNGGRNYGWVHREGFNPTPGVAAEPPFPGAPTTLTDPVYVYPHPTGISVTGGFVYRGAALAPGFTGRYVFADLNGKVWSLAIDAEPGRIIVSNLVEHTARLGGSSISAFGRDAAGELYIVQYGAGAILKIAR